MNNVGKITIPLSDQLHRWDDETDDLLLRCPICGEWKPMHHSHIIALSDEEEHPGEVELEFV